MKRHTRSFGRSSYGVPLGIATLIVGSTLVAAQRPGPQLLRSPRAAAALVFDSVTVVDVVEGRVRPNQRVVVVGRRIHAVGPVAAVPLPPNGRVVPAATRYLIPGLWDMHSHPVDEPQFAYPLFIAQGVTGIRNASTWVPIDSVRRWQQEILIGGRVGPPRQLITGPSLDDVDADFGAGLVNLGIETPEEGRRAVDSLHAAGADFLKVHVLNSREVYFAIAAEARRLGLPVSGHLPRGVTVQEASDSGQRAFDHLYSLPPECVGDSASVAACTPVVAQLRRNDSWLIPTLELTGGPATLTGREVRARLRYLPEAISRSVWPNDIGDDSPKAFTGAPSPWPRDSSVRGVLALLRQSGGDARVLAGTDVGAGVGSAMHFMPGFSLHDELELLVAAGLSPASALRAATLNPARFLHATDSLGTVAAGQLADLVMLDANPLADITNTRRIHAVVADGRYFDRAALDELLARLEQAGDPRWRERPVPNRRSSEPSAVP